MQKRRCQKLASNLLKPSQNSFIHLELSHWKCNGQLSRSCVPNLSCNHFNQWSSSKGKITRTLFCLTTKKQALHYIKQNLQATCLYITVEFALLQSQGGVEVEYLNISELNISMICGGGADAQQNFSQEERMRSQKNESPSISYVYIKNLVLFLIIMVTICS